MRRCKPFASPALFVSLAMMIRSTSESVGQRQCCGAGEFQDTAWICVAGDGRAGAVMLDGDSLAWGGATVQAPSFRPLLIISSEWSIGAKDSESAKRATCK